MFIDRRATRRSTPPGVQCPNGAITPDGVTAAVASYLNMQLLAELEITGTLKSAGNED